jgi:probable rRNA maturation factor
MRRAVFTVFQASRTLQAPRKRLDQVAAAIIKGENLPASCSVNVILCSDAAIRRLNREYLGKDRPTDVMAFTLKDAGLLGEVYISLERARVQAPRFGLTYNQEVVRLLVHGAVHLLGYDHETAVEKALMEKREARYCKLGHEGRAKSWKAMVRQNRRGWKGLAGP